MFLIEDGRMHFWQWDKDQRLVVHDDSINEVHFCNKTSECSLVCEVYQENGKRLVNVPNILLQDNWDIEVYAYCDNCTKYNDSFAVYKRSKPDDYIYTETEIKNYDDLKARIDEIEKNGVSQDTISSAVNAYLNENPIEAGATTEQAAQIAQNKTDITALKSAASGYALKSEIPSLTGYATESYVAQKITEAQLSGKEVDLSNYYTKAQVNALIPDTNNFITSIPSEYVTETELNAKGYLTAHQSLASYSTTTQVQNMINTAIAGITDAEAVNY